MTEKYLIRNTTREERELLVLEAMGCCEGCDDSISDADLRVYQPYIDGELELNECTRLYRTGYVKGGMEQSRDTGCGWTK